MFQKPEFLPTYFTKVGILQESKWYVQEHAVYSSINMLLHMSLRQGKLPSLGKKSTMRSIPREKMPTYPNSYSPIVLRSNIMNMFEHLIKN